MKKNLTIKDLFYNSDFFCDKGSTIDPTGYENYLFYQLSKLVPTDWEDKDGNVIPMDFFEKLSDLYVPYGLWKRLEREYFHNYSKDKLTSVICDEIGEDEDFWTSNATYQQYIVALALDIAQLYMPNWCRMWYALNEKYRPLDNVDGTDKTTYQDFTRESTNDGWNTVKEGSVNNSASNSVYGFNSSSGVPQSSSSGSTTPQNDVSTATPHKDKGGNTVLPSMNSNQQSIGENSNTNKEKTTGDIVNTRHGNIGVTKSTDLLEAEMEFRKNYNFYKIVFDNIDDVLTCHTYNGGDC